MAERGSTILSQDREPTVAPPYAFGRRASAGAYRVVSRRRSAADDTAGAAAKVGAWVERPRVDWRGSSGRRGSTGRSARWRPDGDGGLIALRSPGSVGGPGASVTSTKSRKCWRTLVDSNH